ncbi:hypothetical protein F5882DRAFT_468994 [Hyaloscypha sp. PMI_1271]|nr:hypothetical protein F5882DRAFT_468994 [Hyaloscypha sp. PMI_1271]
MAGTTIQTIDKLRTLVVSKSKIDMYIKEGIENMFKPRLPRVNIASTEAMRSILGIPDTQPALAPLTPEAVQMSTLERELLAVREYNAVLDLEVPSPAEQTTMLAKLSARQVEGLARKNQKKAVNGREKTAEKDEEEATMT